jgi:mannose-6-phosphate isomerase-like protein (cupin superfamily)
MNVLLREAEVLAPGEGTIIPLPGATMVFKAHSGVGVCDFLVGEFTAEPGFAGPRPHRHRVHEELFSVLEGEFDFFVEDQTVRLGAGAFVTVPPGVLHDFRNPGEHPARWLGIVAPGGLDRYFAEIHDLAVSGQLTDARLRELRLRYDTEEPDAIPPGHWAAQAKLHPQWRRVAPLAELPRRREQQRQPGGGPLPRLSSGSITPEERSLCVTNKSYP